jgi:O-antigen ligase
MKWLQRNALSGQELALAAKSSPKWIGFGWLFSAFGVMCALLVVKPILGLSIVGATIGIFLIVFILAAIWSGKVEPIILTWVLIFPLGYYFLSFPREKSIITLDRVLPVALVLAIGLAPRNQSKPLPRDLRHCAIAWTAFLVFAGISLIHATDIFASGKLLVDGFCLPAILGWLVIRNFEVTESAAWLHGLTSLMCVYVACIGAAEMVLKQDLLPLPGSELSFAGPLPRPNGPFASNDALGVIGFVAFFMLLFLRNLLGENLSFGRRFVHNIGLIASLAMILMPMWRSLDIALIVVLLIATLSTRKPSRRLMGFALLFLCFLALWAVAFFAPDTYADRSNPDNGYARLAEQYQTWHVFSSHPIFGVGLGSFHDVVNQDTRYLAFYDHVRSVDWPHNNLGGILSETGILGFIPYVTAQGMMFLIFWRLRKLPNRSAQLAWTYFLYIFLGYWIHGMAESSGYSSDLNLWFVFSIAVLYKYSMTVKTVPAEVVQGDETVPEFASDTFPRKEVGAYRPTVSLKRGYDAPLAVPGLSRKR